MKRQILFLLSLVLVGSTVSVAQTKTITNADLEKFKQRRLKAEKELRENYKELGFPSPEELKRRNEKSRKELSELADKLRKERLAREQNNNRNVSNSVNSERVYSDSDENRQTSFTDYQRYRVNTYIYRPYRRNWYFNNNQYRRNNRFYRNNNRVRFRGYIGPKVRNQRNNRFGPSRRLTRQNQRKSNQNKSGFGNFYSWQNKLSFQKVRQFFKD